MSKLQNLFGPHHGLDERSVDALVKALERKNLPGFDYLEYKQSLDALANMGLNGETAYKSAYATATVLGLTKDKLLQTAEHYKKVLMDEKTQFEASMQRHLEQRVESKRKEVELLKKKVEEYRQKIQQLEAQIASSEATIDQADAEIQSARERIHSASENFDYTLRSILNNIDQDIEHIRMYL